MGGGGGRGGRGTRRKSRVLATSFSLELCLCLSVSEAKESPISSSFLTMRKRLWSSESVSDDRGPFPDPIQPDSKYTSAGFLASVREIVHRFLFGRGRRGKGAVADGGGGEQWGRWGGGGGGGFVVPPRHCQRNPISPGYAVTPGYVAGTVGDNGSAVLLSRRDDESGAGCCGGDHVRLVIMLVCSVYLFSGVYVPCVHSQARCESTVGDSGLCCCVCVTSPLFVDFVYLFA